MNTLLKSLACTLCVLLLPIVSNAATTLGAHELEHTTALTQELPVTHPVVMLGNNTRSRDGKTQIKFSALGQDFTLNLQPSPVLQLSAHNNNLPTLLQGTVAGFEDSWARISISDGKPTGYVSFNNRLYQLALSEDVFNAHTDAQWVMFEPNPSTNTRIATRIDTPQTVTRTIRIGIAIDTEFDNWYRGRGLAKALEIINGVDGLYQNQLGVAVIVESVSELNTLDKDPIQNIEGSLKKILMGFRDYQITQPKPNNPLTLTHLFSGHRDPAGVLGLGWIDTACRTDNYNLSVSTPFAFDVLLAAHEMAHNLGALHDDDLRCDVNANDIRNTLMVSKLTSSTTSALSSCSLNKMQAAIERSCNLDNIDVGINLSSAPTNDANNNQRELNITVNNTDEFRTASTVKSRTAFPQGSALYNVPNSCTFDQDALLCTHNAIEALGNNTVSVTVDLFDTPTPLIISTIELTAFSDINTSNNGYSIDALTDTGLEFAQADNGIASLPISGGSSGLGLGRIDFWLMMLLLTAGLQRNRATCRD